MMDGPDPDDLAYCADRVRSADPDRFATVMMAPVPIRYRLLALYAFNLEIASLREQVREPMLGQIRLQWWRDAIDECKAGAPRRHQVVQPLAWAMRDGGLDDADLLAAIDARAEDLSDAPPADDDAIANYVAATGGVIGALAARSCGGDAEYQALGAAAGRAWAWVGLARGAHHHRRLGRRTVPASRLAASVSLDDDLALARSSDAVRDLVRWMCGKADGELAVLRAARRSPTTLRPALAPGLLASVYAKRLERAGFDPFHGDVAQLGAGRRAWVLLRFSLGARF